MITALRVRGPFRGPSGYDHYVREFVRELVRQGVAIQLVDLPDWGLPGCRNRRVTSGSIGSAGRSIP